MDKSMSNRRAGNLLAFKPTTAFSAGRRLCDCGVFYEGKDVTGVRCHFRRDEHLLDVVRLVSEIVTVEILLVVSEDKKLPAQHGRHLVPHNGRSAQVQHRPVAEALEPDANVAVVHVGEAGGDSPRMLPVM